MAPSILCVIFGLALLVWSADRFVDGASSAAKHFGMSPLLIGMLIVGFGTSAPELVVSVLAALDGSPGIALGNAYGSNIANIGLILGVTALVSPIMIHSRILRKELPLLTLLCGLSVLLLSDSYLGRLDALVLLAIFSVLIGWTIHQGRKTPTDALGSEMGVESGRTDLSLKQAMTLLVSGLVLLVVSSRMLVWGAVNIARTLGVSDTIIGLTIVALGTSLPELASAIAASRKGEDDIAIGNVLGSNMFNTLAVVGLAVLIHPFAPELDTLPRDMLVMSGLTVSLFLFGYGFKGRTGRINRFEGTVLLVAYLGYMALLAATVYAPKL